jgi:acetyltransferase-like isoleucine patch superfamily enzyme
MTEKSVSENYIDQKSQIKQLLKLHPFEWLRILGIGLTTFKYRFLMPCIGRKTVVARHTQIINFSNVQIADHCLILENAYFRAGIGGSIKIANNVAINSFAKIFAHGGVTIGAYSQLGPGVLVTTTTHDYGNNMETAFKQVTIGEWVWIGGNAVILPGVTLGDHVVIGAGSVVTKDIPSYSVAVGNPARIIKTVENVKNVDIQY